MRFQCRIDCRKEMDMEETSSYYRVNKSLLNFIGHWPYQAKLNKFFIRSFIYISLITFIVPQLLAFRETWGNMDAAIECIPPTIIAFASLILFTNIIYNVNTMERLFIKINGDWITYWSLGQEIKILRSYTEKGKSLSIAYATLVFSILGFFLAVPILPPILDIVAPLNSSRPKEPLFPGEYYVDLEDYFYWILLHGYVASIVTMVIIVTVDTLYMVILQHACGILSILGFRLNSILQCNKKSTKMKITFQETIDHEIIFCAKKHKSVIVFINDVRKCFSTAFFIVLGLNMLNMVVTGVQTVTKLGDLNEVIRFGSYTFGQMFHLFFLTMPSQHLIDHSIKISDYIYDGYWYELSIQSQKMLLIMMRRSSEPCSFTAGKLYKFSMQSFATVLHTSMSYFTVLLSFCQYNDTSESRH